MTKTLDTTLIEVSNSLRLMEQNEMDSSEREDKLNRGLSEMKARYTEVKEVYKTNEKISFFFNSYIIKLI